MAFEARIAAGPGVQVISRQNAMLADALARLDPTDCLGVASFGTAGGLSDVLRPGDWVIARAVLDGTTRFETDTAWSQALRGVLPQAHWADLAGVASAVTARDDKRALHRAGGAVAADMESHIVARWAAMHGLPFVCCRVVIDPASRSLPPAALAGLRGDGTTDVWRVMRSLMANPLQLSALLALAGDARRAQRAMRAGRVAIGAMFGYPDKPRQSFSAD